MRARERVAMPTLEDYIYDMEQRVSLGDVVGGSSEVDVWAQLHQKEQDLQLAAELGKALLDKNEELKRQQEHIIEEYGKKLEVRIVFLNLINGLSLLTF